MNRRALITGLISFVAAPAIVRASSLMPVKSFIRLDDWYFEWGSSLTIDVVLKAKQMMEAAKLTPYFEDRYLAITFPEVRRAPRHARAAG